LSVGRPLVSRQTGLVSSSHVLTDPTLRIGVYNIAHGRGDGAGLWEKIHGVGLAGREKRLVAITKLLREANLDVLVLNEVDFAVVNSGHVNQAERIAREAGFSYWLEQRNNDANLFGLRFQAGNAILSRHPIVDAELITYPKYRPIQRALLGDKRGMICTIQPVDGSPFRLVAVHLDHSIPAARVATARLLKDLVAKQKLPVVLAGDFNSAPKEIPGYIPDENGDSAVQMLIETHRHLPDIAREEGAELTFPSAQSELALDWILVPEHWRLKTKQSPAGTLSDHRPVFADVVVGERK
jgi:endonuclease/exonuclease/phosphatase family metal-dependent hydrolase